MVVAARAKRETIEGGKQAEGASPVVKPELPFLCFAIRRESNGFELVVYEDARPIKNLGALKHRSVDLFEPQIKRIVAMLGRVRTGFGL
jgi:hypothetical protein